MKKLLSILLLLCLLLTLCSCAESDKTEDERYDAYIYYLNTGRTDLEASGFNYGSEKGQDLADKMVSRISKLGTNENSSPLPEGVVIDKVKVLDGSCHVYLNTLYNDVNEKEQVLCRAALVKTFIQIDQVSSVTLYVGDERMKDESGHDFDEFKADDFLCTSSTLPSEDKERVLTIYFADEEAFHLTAESIPVTASIDENIIYTIVSKLIEGPSYDNEKAVLPEDTQIISVSVKGNTAFVNLNDEFSEINLPVTPDLAIYSIVNSITANTKITSVQIQIEGKTPSNFGERIDLRQPLKEKKILIL